MSKFIEVQQFGDFDILQSKCVMYKVDNIVSAEALRAEFCELEGIRDPTEIYDLIINDVTDNFIAFLELLGFEKVVMDSTYFCN